MEVLQTAQLIPTNPARSFAERSNPFVIWTNTVSDIIHHVLVIKWLPMEHLVTMDKFAQEMTSAKEVYVSDLVDVFVEMDTFRLQSKIANLQILDVVMALATSKSLE